MQNNRNTVEGAREGPSCPGGVARLGLHYGIGQASRPLTASSGPTLTDGQGNDNGNPDGSSCL